MKKLIFVLITVLFITGIGYANRVWVEDNDVVIPIDTDSGDVKSVNNHDGTQTWIYDHGNRTDIVHGDGTTTSVYDNN